MPLPGIYVDIQYPGLAVDSPDSYVFHDEALPEGDRCGVPGCTQEATYQGSSPHRNDTYNRLCDHHEYQAQRAYEASLQPIYGTVGPRPYFDTHNYSFGVQVQPLGYQSQVQVTVQESGYPYKSEAGQLLKAKAAQAAFDDYNKHNPGTYPKVNPPRRTAWERLLDEEGAY